MKVSVILILVLLVNSCTTQDLHLYSYAAQKMGVDFRIDLFAKDESLAVNAVEKAFKRIDDINSKMSDYIVDSELWQISESSGKGEKIKVSDDMWKILTFSRLVNEQSEGAFDITAGPYILMWRKARVIKRHPSERSMARAANKVGMTKIKFDPEAKAVELIADNMRLDLGGIAKGYAADEALKSLQEYGIKYAMVDGSGDISMTSHPQGEWEVFISDNKAPAKNYVKISDAAIATSGDTYQNVVINGKKYSHIVDPKTGVGVTGSYRVTVIAQSGKQADALASALTVMGPKKGLRLVERLNRVEALIEKIEDGKVVTFKSSGFPKVYLK